MLAPRQPLGLILCGLQSHGKHFALMGRFSDDSDCDEEQVVIALPSPKSGATTEKSAAPKAVSERPAAEAPPAKKQATAKPSIDRPPSKAGKPSQAKATASKAAPSKPPAKPPAPKPAMAATTSDEALNIAHPL